MSNKSKLKQLDAFTQVDADIPRGAEVTSKSFEEDARYQQEILNEIDIESQRMNGRIKPIGDQFPGEASDNDSRLNVLEVDQRARKNQLASDKKCLAHYINNPSPARYLKQAGIAFSVVSESSTEIVVKLEGKQNRDAAANMLRRNGFNVSEQGAHELKVKFKEVPF